MRNWENLQKEYCGINFLMNFMYVYLSSSNLHPQRIIKFDPYLLFIEIKQWKYIPMNLWKTGFPQKIVPCEFK